MAPDERSAEILAAVRVAMNQFGVRRLTVSDVALQAGLSRQTIYEHFPSRDALVEAAIEAAGLEVIASAETSMPASAAPVERLTSLIEAVLTYFRGSPLWSMEAKRAEFVPHVALGDGVFAAAATQALDQRLGQWWPDADRASITRAADTLTRTLISHGLSPEDGPVEEISQQLAALVAGGL